jgi:membrane protease YdiL (CAAX protease family)
MADPTILPPPPPPSPHYTIFRGPNGIRAGWRVLLFLVFVAGIILVITALIGIGLFLRYGSNAKQHNFGLGGVTPLGLGVTEGLLFFVTALAAWIMSLIERRKWGQYGLPLRHAFRQDFWIGLVIGFLAISAALFGIFLFRGFHLTGIATHGQELVKAIMAWSITFLLVGLAEEFSFRGYLQYTLTTGIGFWPTAILLSVSFGAAHYSNPGESQGGLLSVVFFGLLFCFVLLRRGNLWWAVGFHAGWDWGQTFFYGVPDSGIPPYHNFFNSTFSGPPWLTGGTVGPEASIFTPIVLALVAIVFSRFYRENLYAT